MKKKTGAKTTSGSAKRGGGGSKSGKAGARKPVGSGTASAQRARLEEQLREAIGQIDEEGLLFLLQQAQILLHNAQVENINREIEELHGRKGTAGSGAAGSGAAGSGAASRAAAVRIDEAENRKSFFLELNRTRKALSLPEMQRVVQICYAADSKSAALRQLYTFFSRERGDILTDARIAGPTSPILDGLFQAVREKYRLEDR
jgi:hypothetical protein